MPKFLKNFIDLFKERAPSPTHALATIGAIIVLVYLFNSMTDLDDDPLRYPGRDYHDEARVAKKKAAGDSSGGYYFNYEGYTYFQPSDGSQPRYIGPAEDKAPEGQ